MAGECVRITSDSRPPAVGRPDDNYPNDSDGDEEHSDEHEQIYSEETCHIYVRKFDGSPAIPGLVTNVAAIFRDNFHSETARIEKNPLVLDVVRQEEKAMTTEICRYLVQNGTHDIQVVSNFFEYVQPIEKDLIDMKDALGVKVRRTKRLRREDSTDVTVVLLLNCCGQLQQLRMGRLVIDSFRASRVGVVIIGSSELLKDQFAVPAWEKLLTLIRDDGTLKDHLEIFCKQHQLFNPRICNAEELLDVAPNGGCDKICGKMDCGHHCSNVCHPMDPDHKSEVFRCWNKCTKTCPLGHKCKKFCWEDCGNCRVVVTVQLPCEHFSESEKQICCYEQPDYLCKVMVKKLLKCSHFIMTACSKDVDSCKCEQVVGGLMKCGHGYTFHCWENAKFREKMLSCRKTCEFKLKCGHQCGRPCHMEDPGHEAIKCQKLCDRKCPRGIHSCRQTGHACSDPCEPCDQIYDLPLECGHFYSLICSGKLPDKYVCREACLRQYAFCRHQCRKRCSDDCGRCEYVMTKVAAGCDRGHPVAVRCQEKVPDRCKFMMNPKVRPDCGHHILVYCYEADTITKQELSVCCGAACIARFDKENECGHKCRGNCADCFQGRLHVRCKEPCGKVLICGHNCTSPCGMVCPPCRYPCMNNCDHGKCEYECGVPCVRSCKQPCTYMCKHSKCSKLCSEVCDKAVCYEPCEKVLSCGHLCVGFCGEDCPPYCRVCSPEELLKGSFSGNQEVGSGDRFIYLKDCKHCIESDAMESWISVTTDQILPIRCPICSVRISWIRRYSSIMTANFELINAVRIKIFGKPEEIEIILLDVRNEIEAYNEETQASEFLSEFKDRILEELDWPLLAAPEPEQDLQSISLEKAKFLKWASREWICVTQILAEFYIKLPPQYYTVFKEYWEQYMLDMISLRIWPLHPNETRAVRIEKKRLGHTIELYSRMCNNQKGRPSFLVSSVAGMKVFQEAEEILKSCKPYTERMRKDFLEHLEELDGILQCTIQLTESERVDIVRAFGEGSGRWFKCQNGHVYVVTECGGATEVGECNECGASVGGQNHQLVEQNYLATEMDGAQQPLYPTALMRNLN